MPFMSPRVIKTNPNVLKIGLVIESEKLSIHSLVVKLASNKYIFYILLNIKKRKEYIYVEI